MIKIGFINTSREPYPSPQGVTNGGLAITGVLADSVSRKVFDPYFFTASDSHSTAKIISFGEPSYFKETKRKALHEAYSAHDNKLILLKEQKLFLKALDFCHREGIELLHVHNNIFNIASLLPLVNMPVVFTSHDPITPEHRDLLKGLKHFHFITISRRQEEEAKKNGIAVAKTIYNGVDTNLFSFNRQKVNGLLYVGRLVAYKGIREAIEAALLAKVPLDIVGQFGLKEKDMGITDYCRRQFSKNKTMLRHYPMLTKREIVMKYRHAKLTLFPSIHREEPFGLVPVESMSCGTPVVAFAQGAAPELIVDGKTGFLVNASPDDIRGDWIVKKTGVAGLREAIERIYSIPNLRYDEIMRQDCREHVENNLSLDRMVRDYEELYLQILGR